MSKKILIVDDDRTFARGLKTFLVDEGFDVYTAHQHNEAINFCINNKPDLILMDIMLPEVNGAEIIKQLQDISLADNVSILFLSAIAPREDDSPDGKIRVGDRDYPSICKPFSTDQLLTKISGIMNIMDN